MSNSRGAESSTRISSFAGDVLTLASGTALSQILVVIVAPLVSRLYTPAEIGVAAIFTSISGIFVVIACMRYEVAIILPKSDDEAANIFALSIGIVFLITILTFPLLLLFRQPLLVFLKIPEINDYLWLIPFAVLFGGLFLPLNYWNTRSKQYKNISVAKFINSFVLICIQLVAGFLGYATSGNLILAIVISSIISSLVLAFQIWKSDHDTFIQFVRWNKIFNALVRYRKFPLFDSWALLLNNISWQVPTFLLAAYFSSAEVGYYSLGNRLLRMPMSLIGLAIGQVFSQRAARAKLEGNLSVVVDNVFNRLVILGMYPLLVTTIIGRDIFIVFLGVEWSEAGVYTQILSVWMFFWFISSPLGTLFRILEKQETSLFINILIFITRFGALIIGGIIGNARIAILLFAISGVILYGYLSLSVIVTTGIPIKRIIYILGINLIRFLPGGVLLIILKTLNVKPLFTTIWGCVILGLYYLYVIRSDPQFKKFLKDIKIGKHIYLEDS